MRLFTIFILLMASLLSAEPAKVKLHLLDHTRKKPTEKKFWIDWSDRWRVIEKTKIIEGEDAQKIIEQLRSSLENRESTNMCGHDPIYGIVARGKDGKLLKTSLCFKCGTWVKPKKRLNIKGEYGINNPLCLLLRKHIELPQSLLEKANGKDKVSEQDASSNH